MFAKSSAKVRKFPGSSKCLRDYELIIDVLVVREVRGNRKTSPTPPKKGQFIIDIIGNRDVPEREDLGYRGMGRIGLMRHIGNNRKALRRSYYRGLLCFFFLFFCMTKRKETKEKSPAVCRALPKIWGRSNFGGDKTRCAQTVSPLTEILAPFLTPDTMPE